MNDHNCEWCGDEYNPDLSEANSIAIFCSRACEIACRGVEVENE